jgi:hypothetical protein
LSIYGTQGIIQTAAGAQDHTIPACVHSGGVLDVRSQGVTANIIDRVHIYQAGHWWVSSGSQPDKRQGYPPLPLKDGAISYIDYLRNGVAIAHKPACPTSLLPHTVRRIYMVLCFSVFLAQLKNLPLPGKESGSPGKNP